MAEPRDTLRLFAIPRLLFAVVVIWAGWHAMTLRNRRAAGTVVVDGTSFSIDACKRVPLADPDSLGADLRDADRNVLRVVRDDHGVQLWLYPTGSGAAIPIDRGDCSQWKVSFFSEAAGPLQPVGGDVTLTCAAGGRKIDGTVFFEHCGS